MKKNVLILLTLSCTILFTLPASALMKNEPENFRGIPWFAPYKGKMGFNKWGLKETERTSVTTTFKRKNDKLQIGAAQLKSIEYIFGDNVGLVQVIVSVENAANIDALLKSCTENWGEPKNNQFYKIYTWVGKKTKAELWVYEDGISAELLIEVKKMSELIEEQENKLAKKDF